MVISRAKLPKIAININTDHYLPIFQLFHPLTRIFVHSSLSANVWSVRIGCSCKLYSNAYEYSSNISVLPGINHQRPDIYQAVRNEHPGLDLDGWVDEDAFHPRHNIAPRSWSAVVRRRNRYDDPAIDENADEGGSHSHSNENTDDGNDDGNGDSDSATQGPQKDSRHKSQQSRTKESAVLHTMKWGLVPHWSKHEDTSLNTINAKGENLTEGSGGMWNSIKGKKRCAVLCQGYVHYNNHFFHSTLL